MDEKRPWGQRWSDKLEVYDNEMTLTQRNPHKNTPVWVVDAGAVKKSAAGAVRCFSIWISVAKQHKATQFNRRILFGCISFSERCCQVLDLGGDRNSRDVRIWCRGDEERGADREKLHHSWFTVDVDRRLLSLTLQRKFSSTFTASAGSVKTRLEDALWHIWRGWMCLHLFTDTFCNLKCPQITAGGPLLWLSCRAVAQIYGADPRRRER